MKKLLIGLLGASVIFSAGTSVVSCTKAAWAAGEDGQRVMVVTDGGTVTDKSFNQSAWQAMVNYTDKQYSVDSTKNFVQSTSSNTGDLLSAYKLAEFRKANTLVMAGFAHANTVAQFASQIGKDKTIILADSSCDADNVISLIYNSELSGFAAGFDAAVWSTTEVDDGNGGTKLQGDANGDGTISFGTFAGISSKQAVDNYNWGFLVGAEAFNELQDASSENLSSTWTEKYDHHIYFANSGSQATADKISAKGPTDANWFTSSFELGAAEQSGIITKLEANGADVIFGVAGPQTQDILQHKGGYNPYVVGVDTDQSESYSGYAGRFLSSATKNLVSSIDSALQHTRALINSDGSKRSSEDCWDGTQPTPEADWSMNQTASSGSSLNLEKQSAIAFENATNGDDTSKMADLIKEFYANAGDSPQEYIQGSVIKDLAKQLVDNYKDLLIEDAAKTL